MNKDPDLFPEEDPPTILDSKYAVFMARNDMDNNNTRNISIIIHFLSNGGNGKIHKIDWCEEGLQLEDIAIKNVGEDDLNPRMKYIMVRRYISGPILGETLVDTFSMCDRLFFLGGIVGSCCYCQCCCHCFYCCCRSQCNEIIK